MSLGRVEASCPSEEDEFRRFAAEPLAMESAAGWQAFDDALRVAYQRPERPAVELDELVDDDGWRPLYGKYRELCNSRYLDTRGR
jgi:hypothetical protein